MTTGDLFQIRNVDMAELRRERKPVQHLILTMIPRSSVMEVGATAVEDVIGKQDVDFVVRVTGQPVRGNPRCFGRGLFAQ
jgi:hypothetical protein